MKHLINLFSISIVLVISSLIISSCGDLFAEEYDYDEFKGDNVFNIRTSCEVTKDCVYIRSEVDVPEKVKDYQIGIIYTTSTNPDNLYVERRPDRAKCFVEYLTDSMFTLDETMYDTRYYYRVFVKKDGLYYYGETETFSSPHFIREAVDLGLSVKWANCNLNASAPYECGDYFAWGGIKSNTVSDYYTTSTLPLENDAANVHWGSQWRIPTAQEFKELFTNCKCEWKENYRGSGINGAIISGNNNSIFIPAGGHYETPFGPLELFSYNSIVNIWTSSSNWNGTNKFVIMGEIDSSGASWRNQYARRLAPIRPVLQ